MIFTLADFPALESSDGSGILILGQEQDIPGGGFDAKQSFSGHLTQVNFWRR